MRRDALENLGGAGFGHCGRRLQRQYMRPENCTLSSDKPTARTLHALHVVLLSRGSPPSSTLKLEDIKTTDRKKTDDMEYSHLIHYPMSSLRSRPFRCGTQSPLTTP